MGNYAAVWLKGCSHYVVQGLRILNRCEERKARQGICIEGSPLGITEDITVEECEITQVDGENRRSRPVYESMYWKDALKRESLFLEENRMAIGCICRAVWWICLRY